MGYTPILSSNRNDIQTRFIHTNETGFETHCNPHRPKAIQTNKHTVACAKWQTNNPETHAGENTPRYSNTQTHTQANTTTKSATLNVAVSSTYQEDHRWQGGQHIYGYSLTARITARLQTTESYILFPLRTTALGQNSTTRQHKLFGGDALSKYLPFPGTPPFFFYMILRNSMGESPFDMNFSIYCWNGFHVLGAQCFHSSERETHNFSTIIRQTWNVRSSPRYQTGFFLFSFIFIGTTGFPLYKILLAGESNLFLYLSPKVDVLCFLLASLKPGKGFTTPLYQT